MSYILNALKKSEQERAADANPQRQSAVSYALQQPTKTSRLKPAPVVMAVGGGGVAVLLAMAVWAAVPWPAAPDNSVSTVSNLSPPLSADASTAMPETITRTDLIAAAMTFSPPPAAMRVPRHSAPAETPGADLKQDAKHDLGIERATTPTGPLQRSGEPAAGGRLATQRTPRPLSGEADLAAPLVVLRLDPPTPPPGMPASPVQATPVQPAAVEATVPPPRASDETPQPASETASDTRDDTDDIVVAAVAPPRADRLSLSDAADLHEKGWGFERSGDFPRAVEAFSRALDLRPDFADAYFGRAWIHDRMDQLAEASADYGHAIRIEPNFAVAYSNRGVARFYLNELAAAEADFTQALQHGRGDLRRFAVLWRYLSAEHDGRDGAAQLLADTRDVNLDRWPGVIAEFYLGQTDIDTVLDRARGADPVATRERLCVAYFFIAQKYLLDGRAVDARDYFQKAVGTGVTDFIQYKAAQRELNRLTMLR